jgi:hypothetical protein
MFRPKQDSDQTRIKLPRRSLPPTIDYLQFAFVQAFQYREKEVEITWTDYSGTKLFILVLKAEREKNVPIWSLWEDSSKGAQFVWSAETSDLEVVEKKIASFDSMNKELTAQNTKPVEQDSPYKKMFSSSYHGIKAPPQNSIRDSFLRMKPIQPIRSDGSISAPNNQAISTHKAGIVNQPTFSQPAPSAPPQNFSQQPLVSESLAGTLQEEIGQMAPSIVISRSILEEFKKLTGNTNIPSVYAVGENIISGTLEHTALQNRNLIKILSYYRLTGKLELINQDSGICRISFHEGVPRSASVVLLDEWTSEVDLTAGPGDIVGDEAIVETMVWTASSFKFFIDQPPLEHNMSHLEKAGLKDRSIILKKQDGLAENELRLLLSKHADSDITDQIELYKRLPKKFTAADIFQDGPITKAVWIPIVYRFFANGLIDIKPPLAVNESALDFTEEGKAAVQTLKANFIRQESGILSYPALLYFLQYEYLRYQSYDIPVSLIIFEMSKISNTAIGGLDLINKQETAIALHRLNNLKRPLDFLGHFETINYALLLPNTNMNTAVQMAKHIVKILTAQPLVPDLDPSLLKLSFGVGSIPYDCESVEELIVLSKKALLQSKNGDFMIVQAGSVK